MNTDVTISGNDNLVSIIPELYLPHLSDGAVIKGLKYII